MVVPAVALTAATMALTGAATLAGAAGRTLTLDRSTGLLDGQLVTVTGSGFDQSSPGAVLECSAARGQPTVLFDGNATPVSCTTLNGGSLFSPPFVETDQNGAFTTTFVVQTGIVGPPTLGVDSAGHSAAADAALFPCPPTQAQQAVGETCELVFGTAPDDAASAPITFGTPITPHPAASAAPATGLSDGQQVTVHATGFTPGAAYAVLECNVTPGAPPGQLVPTLPASCTAPGGAGNGTPFIVVAPSPPATDASGDLTTAFTAKEGNIGASQQTVAYPCPPTAANVAAGGSCQIVVIDGAYETASVPITLTGPVPKPSVIVFPAGGLRDGSMVGVIGSRFVPLSPGAIVECNETPGQPTVPIDGFPGAVGCSNPFSDGGVTGVSPSGALTGSIRIQTGVVGPIQPGTDSAGRDAAADAAAYPCPPTAAQQAQGVTCDIVVGDVAGDSTAEPVAFASSSPGYPAAPGAGLAADPEGGYWTVGSDGGVFSEAGAPYLGSLPGLHLRPAAPVVGIAATPDGRGYWLLSADGGVYGFGDAVYRGSLPQLGVGHAPAVAIAPTVDGRGYWIVAGDGGVFAFGDAAFLGSILSHPPPVAASVVAATADPGGQGYWLLGSDGSLYPFGAVGDGGPGVTVAPGVPLPPGKGGRLAPPRRA